MSNYLSIPHYRGTRAAYDANKDKYADGIFFTTDTHEIITGGTANSISYGDVAIANAKNELIGSATDDHNTLGKLENYIEEIEAKASAGKTVVNAKTDGHVTVKVELKTDDTTKEKYSEVTVSENDIASKNDLDAEITRAKAAEDAIEASVGLDAKGNHITTTGNYTSTATTVVGEIAALDTQVKKNSDAIDVLNGNETKTGSVAKSIKDAIDALDVAEVGASGKFILSIKEENGKIVAVANDLKAANVAATAIAKGDDTVAIDGTTVEAQITNIGKAIKEVAKGAATYAVKKVTTGLASNVKEAYQLVQTIDGTSTDIDVQIPIYKDSSLKSVELVNEDDKGKTGQFLKFTYITNEGAESIVYLDCSTFLVESEFKNGLEVNTSGEVSVKVDATSESFLTVGEGGVKLSGIADAIDADVLVETNRAKAAEKVNADAIAILNGTESTEGSVKKAVNDAKVALIDSASTDYNTLRKLENKIKAAATEVNAKKDGHVTVTVDTTAADGHAVVTVAENDIASSADLANLLAVVSKMYDGQERTSMTVADVTNNLQAVIKSLQWIDVTE